MWFLFFAVYIFAVVAALIAVWNSETAGQPDKQSFFNFWLSVSVVMLLYFVFVGVLILRRNMKI